MNPPREKITPSPPAARLRVLVVAGSVEARHTLLHALHALTAPRVEAHGVSTLQQGLAELHQGLPPDVVLVASELPDARGEEGLKALVAAAPQRAFVALVYEDGEGSAAERALLAGAQEVLPWSEAAEAPALARALRQAMARRRAVAPARGKDPAPGMDVQELQFRLDAIVRSSPLALCTLTADWSVTWGNEAAAALFLGPGADPALLVGRALASFFPREAAPELPALLRRSALEQSRLPVPLRVLQPGGRLVEPEFSVATLDPASSNHGRLLTAVDCTWRREQEARLRESEARYRAIVEGQTDLICRYAPSGVITFANHAFCRTFQRPDGSVTGQSFLSLLPEDQREEMEDHLADLREGAGASAALQRLPLTHGEVRWIEWRETPITDARGRVMEFQAVGRDVTQEHLAAERLSEERRFLRRILDASPNLIFVKDRVGRFLLVNQAMADFHGRPVQEMEGSTEHRLYGGGEKADTYRKQDLEILADQQDRSYPLARARNAAGEERWLLTTKRFLPGAIPAQDTVVGVAVDVTEQHQAQQQLRQREDQLRQSQKMEAIGLLAGGISHDFNNILTIIKGYSMLALMKTRPGEPLAEPLAQVVKATNRATALTRKLLAFSRKQDLRLRVVDLNALLGDFRQMLSRVIGEDVVLGVQLDDTIGPVLADPSQLEQVLLNLAVNARDAMPTGGLLTIATRRMVLAQDDAEIPAGEYAAIEVRDTGHGIPPDVMLHIFEPFFTTKPTGRGTGLGLATAFGIVRQSDGYIRVESEVQRGTQFTVFLPRAQAADVATSPPLEPREAPSSGRRGVILLVEDDPALRSLVHLVLGEYGYDVLMAAGSQEAAEILKDRAGELALLLTDVVMPGMNGAELAELARRQVPDLRVLYMSGYVPSELERYGIGGGGTLLRKPFTPEELIRAVEAVLEGQPVVTPR